MNIDFGHISNARASCLYKVQLYDILSYDRRIWNILCHTNFCYFLRWSKHFYTPATGFTGAERIMSRPDHSVTPSLRHSVTLCPKIVSHFWVPIVRFSPKLASGFVYHPIRRIRSHFGPSPRPPQSFVESGSKIEKCE